MKYAFFAVSSLDPSEGEKALNLFCAQHRVVAVEKQFVADTVQSHWSFCVGYVDTAQKLTDQKGKIDYREKLNEADFSVYSELRTLRKQLSEQEGVPVYAIFTNEQLAEMVTRRVSSVAQLRDIAGIGQARVKKHGEAFLSVLNRRNSLAASTVSEAGGLETSDN